MIEFLRQRWFLLLLLLYLVVGMAAAPQLVGLLDWRWVRDAILASVLFVMALPLESRVIRRTVSQPGPALLATGVTFLLVPLLAWGFSLALPRELGYGLIVAAVTPCTLASAAVWTRRAGGNDATALMVTLITNLACFAVMPAWLWLVMGSVAGSVRIDAAGLARDLGLLVVTPIVLAQLARLHPAVALGATRRKTPLGVVAQLGILTMVFFGAISAGLRLRETLADGWLAAAGGLSAMLVIVAVVHLTMLATGFWLARLCGMPREEQIAVAFSGSQKTLMVGLKVALDLGVSILPMVAYHILQLFLDTLIADRMRRTSLERAASAATPAPASPESTD